MWFDLGMSRNRTNFLFHGKILHTNPILTAFTARTPNLTDRTPNLTAVLAPSPHEHPVSPIAQLVSRSITMITNRSAGLTSHRSLSWSTPRSPPSTITKGVGRARGLAPRLTLVHSTPSPSVMMIPVSLCHDDPSPQSKRTRACGFATTRRSGGLYCPCSSPCLSCRPVPPCNRLRPA